MFKKRRIADVIALMLVMCFASFAQAGIETGVTGDTQLTVPGQPNPTSGSVDFLLEATVALDPAGSRMTKVFEIPADTTIVPGQAFPVWEFITILPSSDGTVPTDWHEEIVDVDFDLMFKWAPVAHIIIEGEIVEGVVSEDGQSVDFDPLPDLAGTTGPVVIEIHKQLIYMGDGPITPSPASDPPTRITVEEWPTIPEPGTLALFGLSALILAGRKQRA